MKFGGEKLNLYFSLTVNGILLTAERKKILEKDIRELLDDLKNGRVKPVEVLEAYQAKAVTVDKDINAICDYILEARDWALELEKIPQEQRGALYGLPISVKVLTRPESIMSSKDVSAFRSVSMCLAMTAPWVLLSTSAIPWLRTAALWLESRSWVGCHTV